jgi:hypothetical protein
VIITLRNCLVPECKADGREHKWEFERPTIQELLRIQETLGLDPDQFEAALNADGLDIVKLRALLVLVQIFHKREGIIVAFEDVDLDIADLEFHADPTPEPEPGKETTTSHLPEADPTGSTSGPSPEAASEPSSSTTAPTSGVGTA